MAKEKKARPQTKAPTSTSPGEPAEFRTVVGGPPKFFPASATSTAKTRGERMGQGAPEIDPSSYADIQQKASGAGVTEWRELDRLRGGLTTLYRTLQEDTRYAEEYKSKTSWERYEKTRARVETLAPKAREKMLGSALSAERQSIPVPEGEHLLTTDTDKLLLTAHERSRIEALVSRAQKAAEKGPFKAEPLRLLKTEYARGLSEGGPGGGATVRAVVGLARDLGLDLDPIVDPHRKNYHRRALEDAQNARMRADLVGKRVPQPPFPNPNEGGTSKGIGTYRSTQKLIGSKKGGPLKLKRGKPHWK